ncbi:MAG TPA: FAD-dependent oxidoreductase, partial [Actinomycetes bacterium]
MPETVDVVVIGGGVIGLSVARELRLAGVDRVLVLEREASVGQGSSSRANGGVRAQFTTRANIEFSAWSIAELERLDARGGLLGFHQTGYLLLCGTEAAEPGLAAAYELQRSLGVEVQWLTPAQALELVPFLRPEGLRAATFHGRDGFLDPHGVVAAMRAEAERLEARIRTGAEVTAIEPAPGGRLDLRAGDRTVRAGIVVNAAGPAAGRVAALCGADLPVAPVRRNLAYVREPEGPGELIPMCVDLDTGVLVRREASGGFVVAWSDPDDQPSWETAVDPRFLEQLAQRVGNRFPLLEDLPLDPRQCWAGLYPETPDHHAVIGPDPRVPALLHCAGFGGHGVMHSPAAGRAVAELVTLGGCR